MMNNINIKLMHIISIRKSTVILQDILNMRTVLGTLREYADGAWDSTRLCVGKFRRGKFVCMSV